MASGAVSGTSAYGDYPGAPEREYNLDLVTTAPSVEYIVIKTDGETKLEIDNPTTTPSRPRLIIDGADCKGFGSDTQGICRQYYGALSGAQAIISI